MTDNVNHPSHYQTESGLEAIQVIEAFFHDNAFLANVFKYIARAGKKGDTVEDLRKAEFYLQREINRISPRLNLTPKGSGGIFINGVPFPFGTTPIVTTPKPRVWQDDEGIPEGVIVQDKDGDWYRRGANSLWEYSEDHGENWFTDDLIEVYPHIYGPYTEVIGV